MNCKRAISVLLSLAFANPASADWQALDQLTASAGTDVLPPISVPATSSMAPLVADIAPTLPAKLTITQRGLGAFDLKAGDSSIGLITRVSSPLRVFTYADAKERCITKARARANLSGPYFDVTDCSERPVGTIKGNVLQNHYSLFDAKNTEIATAQKENWMPATEWTLRRPDGQTIATLRRPGSSILSENWIIEIADHAAVNPHLIIMLAASCFRYH